MKKLTMNFYHWIPSILSIISLNCFEGANILGIFPTSSKSHIQMHKIIMKALAARGHQVTAITPYKSNTSVENYTDILLFDGETFADAVKVEETEKFRGFWKNIVFNKDAEKWFCSMVADLPYIRELITSERKMIDLILVEMHCTRCYALLAYKLNAPIIVVLPPATNIGMDYVLGNPFHVSHTAHIFRPFTNNMNFWQRLTNTVEYSITVLYQYYVHNNWMEKFSEDIFDMELPPMEDLDRQIAMSFVNNYFGFINRATSPNSIPLAGIHIREANELPMDIQDFMDQSTHGVIYFSFGSLIRVSSIDPEQIKMFVEVFSEIPQRILWRADDFAIQDIPSNIRIAKWFPQRDLLEHKNLVALITHGGLFSLLEAIYTETPIIGVPFAFDQFQNVQVAVEKGIAIHLDYDSMNKTSFRKTIDDIVNNTKYRDNMKKCSQILKDRSKSALDEAIYWSEYVIRHKGASHLKPRAADMPMYQYLLLDVIVVALASIIGVLFLYIVVYKIIQRIISSIFNKNEVGNNKYK